MDNVAGVANKLAPDVKRRMATRDLLPDGLPIEDVEDVVAACWSFGEAVDAAANVIAWRRGEALDRMRTILDNDPKQMKRIAAKYGLTTIKWSKWLEMDRPDLGKRRYARNSTGRYIRLYKRRSIVMQPAAESTRLRAKRLSAKDTVRQESAVGSGFGRNISQSCTRELVYPDNVLHGATECHDVGHPAAFPLWLPDFFIKLFTRPGGVVLDPFAGSGSTCLVARQLGRQYIGIEKHPGYFEIAQARLSPF
jgi:DNA modification methylase